MHAVTHRSGRWSRPTVSVLLLTAMITVGALQVHAQTRTTQPRRQAQTPITLTLWHTYNVPEAAQFNKEIAAYQKLNPGIKIDAQEIPFTQRATKIPTAVQTNALPDIVRADYPYQFYLAGVNKALPLQNYLKSWDGYKDIPAWLWQNATVNGNIVAFPESYWPRGLFYNKALFKKAGIAAPPATWAAFIADARKLSQNGVAGFNLQGDAQSGWFQFLYMYGIMGGSIFTDPAHPSAATVNLTSPTARKTLDLYAQLVNNHVIEANPTSNDYNAMVQSFQSGKAAMIIDGSWDVGAFNPIKGLDYGVAPLPTLPGAPYKVVADYSFYVIPSTTKHPKEDLALLEWLESTSNAATWATTLGEIPAIRTSSENAAMVSTYLATSPALKAFQHPSGDFGPTAGFNPPVPYGTSITQKVSAVLQKYLLGRITKAQVLPQMQQAVQTVVKSNS